MPSVDIRVIEAAEAICGGLSKLRFTHLGETDAGQTDWFTRSGGTSAQTVRVRVERGTKYPAVFVTVEYFNKHLNKAGRTVMQLDCRTTRKDLAKEASIQLVQRVLEIFKEVVQGTGVAGPQTAAAVVAWHTAN